MVVVQSPHASARPLEPDDAGGGVGRQLREKKSRSP
jgi:hypothetical protein